MCPKWRRFFSCVQNDDVKCKLPGRHVFRARTSSTCTPHATRRSASTANSAVNAPLRGFLPMWLWVYIIFWNGRSFSTVFNWKRGHFDGFFNRKWRFFALKKFGATRCSVTLQDVVVAIFIQFDELCSKQDGFCSKDDMFCAEKSSILWPVLDPRVYEARWAPRAVRNFKFIIHYSFI